MKTFDTNLILGKPTTHNSGFDSVEQLLHEMDQHDIARGFVTHLAGSVYDARVGNDLLFQNMQDAASGKCRLIPIPVVDIRGLPVDRTWGQWEEAGVRGVRVCPSLHGRGGSESATRDFLERLNSKGWFLQVPIIPYYRTSLETGSVSDAVFFASLMSDLPVLVVGVSRKLFIELLTALSSTPNLYLDVGNLSTGTGIPDLVDAGFGRRLVCGSGAGVSCITPFRDVVLYSGISQEASQLILYDNAIRLSRLPE